MTLLQRVNRVTLLFVLVICLAIKVVHAYSFITGNPDNPNQNTQVSRTSSEILNDIERRVQKPIKKRTEVVSSNVLMVWNEGEDRIGHYTFSTYEFNKLQAFARLVGSDEMESIFRQHRQYSKDVLLAYIDRRLENETDPSLYVFRDERSRTVNRMQAVLINNSRNGEL